MILGTAWSMLWDLDVLALEGGPHLLRLSAPIWRLLLAHIGIMHSLGHITKHTTCHNKHHHLNTDQPKLTELTHPPPGLDAAEKKFGMSQNRATNEKITDGARDFYEKETG